jgi:hypothetical protein
MSINESPIELATDIGLDKYLHVGGLAYPEMEISFLLGTLCKNRKGHYDDRPEARLRRHLLLYWERGFYKTSMITSFLSKGAPACEVTKQETTKQDLPSYLFISGDYTQARLRGSVSINGNLQLPLIQKPNFLVSPELMTMMSGSGDVKSSMVNFLCEVLEEGIGRVGIVSMGNAKISDEKWETMKKRGIIFNKEEATMFYKVNGTFMGASRPLGRADVRYLSKSGFMDRISVIRWIHDRSEFEEQWSWVPQQSSREPELFQMNRMIWRMSRVNAVNYPPADMVRECMRHLNNKYNDIERQNGLPYYLLRSARDGTNIAQLLTAYAYARELVDTGLAIHILDYEKDDVIEVKSRLEDYAESRYKQAMETEEISEKFISGWKFYNQVKDAFKDADSLPSIEKVREEIMRSGGPTGNMTSQSSAYKLLQRWASKAWVKLETPRGSRVTHSKVVRFLK